MSNNNSTDPIRIQRSKRKDKAKLNNEQNRKIRTAKRAIGIFLDFKDIATLPQAYTVKTTFTGGFPLKKYMEERVIESATYIIEHNATVRQTAKQFGVSKSTVHKDVTERLTQVNPSLAKQARKVLDINKSERHIRGGLATREKYLHQH